MVMKKIHIVLPVLALLPCLLVVLNDRGTHGSIADNIVFREKLSEYGLYEGRLSDRKPSKEVEHMAIASPLFTDYAEKQRLVLLPMGQKMKARGNGLPDFPNGTIIAKTFFYPNGTADRTVSDHTSEYVFGRKTEWILETRLLVLHEGRWNAAAYRWNAQQDDALLLKEGIAVPVSFTDGKGRTRTTDYNIPSRADCLSCHRQNDGIFPIGLKMRNMNIPIQRDGATVNQLEYLERKGKLERTYGAQIAPAVDYRNEREPLDGRARAYLDINCAHCHQPSGTAYATRLDLRLETPIHRTEILPKQGKIAYRMTTEGDLHMPRIGTTVRHEEGIKLVLDYIKNAK